MFRFSAISRRLQSAKRSKSTKSSSGKSKAARRMEERPATILPGRHWVPTKFQHSLDMNSTKLSRNQTPFTVVSYNILAQDLVTSHMDLYKDIPEEHLRWSFRKANLLSEITNLRPDILCLQEIQADHLEGFAADLMRRCTFDRVFKKRTGIEKTDGCAIFFNPDMFKLLDVRTVEFNQQVDLLDRDNIAIIAKLCVKDNPRAVFIVSTAHLLFNPRRLDVKLAQVQVLLTEIEQMAFNKNDRYFPIILTGDFNMQPTSTPYNLITDGRIDYTDLPHPIIDNDLGVTNNCQHVHNFKYGREKHRSELTNSEMAKNDDGRKRRSPIISGYEDLFDTGFLSHPLHMTNSYRNLEGRSSTHHHDWIIVDYLFFSRYFNKNMNKVVEGPLKLLSYLELPSTEDCIRMERMPNEVIGSDHFSLAARFLLGNSS